MWCINDWNFIGVSGFIMLCLATTTVLIITNRMSVSKRTSNDSAIDIAQKRYARGEITKGQFESIKKDLFKST